MVRVEKFHGTGNDFVLVDAGTAIPDKRRFGRRLCDRQTGVASPDGEAVGADGVLFCSLRDGADPPRISMTLVQPDGSVAAMCGNGARCAAVWAAERTGATEILIDTRAGTRRAWIEDDGTVTVEMGEPTFDPSAVPVDSTEPWIQRPVAGLTVTAVNTGVPHAVAFVEDVSALDIDAVAPPVRTADVFPEGANVTVASTRARGYDQRTFERGVEGETDSCGTGAVAIAAVAARLDRVAIDEPIPVWPPGGELSVTLGTADGALLRGPATRIFETEVPVGRAD